MKEMICIRGVPRALAKDGWWLETGGPGHDNKEPPPATRLDSEQTPQGWVWTWVHLLIVGLASIWAFWGHSPGLSLVVFAQVVFALSCWRLDDRSNVPKAWGLLVLASLPALDHVQALSVVILGLGLIAALIRTRIGQSPALALLKDVWGVTLHLPRRWIGQLAFTRAVFAFDVPGATKDTAHRPSRLDGLLADWAFPVGGALVTSALLLRANPVLTDRISGAINPSDLLPQLMFGSGVAFLTAPFLARDLHRHKIELPHKTWTLPGFGVNRRSVLRGLAIFNLLLALQTMTDVSIILFGAQLPQDMTLAEFAHRGAYPLLASALLAGGIALVAYPYVRDHRLIRPLMILYVAQNAVLCLAALMRLDLYVQDYGLTYLRVHSLIWMALVALGLCLMLWQISAGKTRVWLAARAAVLAGVTLYACSLVNFAGVIAGYNLSRGTDDHSYVCALGPNAFRAAANSGIGTVGRGPNNHGAIRVDLKNCQIFQPDITGWQEWGLRKWRMAHTVPKTAI